MATIVTSKLEGQHLQIGIAGRFDFSILQELKETYAQYDTLGSSTKLTVSKVTIDLLKSEHMDSSGMGLLLSLKKDLKLDSDALEIKNCRPHIVAALLAARLDHFFRITPL